MNVLVAVDLQNDFIDGALGTKEAEMIVPRAAEVIKSFDGAVFATRDTHGDDYLSTSEGKKLPVAHCIKGTRGHEINSEIAAALKCAETVKIIDKPTFGSVKLAEEICALDKSERVESVTLIGLCTDICVISNAMLLKAYLPETRIAVDASACAGVTEESHKCALESMKACQIEIENEV